MKKAVHVGDDVSFRIGPRHFEGKVIQDLGRTGANGRRLVRVKVIHDPRTITELIVQARGLVRKGVS